MVPTPGSSSVAIAMFSATSAAASMSSVSECFANP